jgi:hypothetical protein
MIAWDDSDKSPENLKKFDQIVAYAKVMILLKEARVSPEDRPKLQPHKDSILATPYLGRNIAPPFPF